MKAFVSTIDIRPQNSLMLPIVLSINRPDGVVMSIFSMTLANPTPTLPKPRKLRIGR